MTQEREVDFAATDGKVVSTTKQELRPEEAVQLLAQVDTQITSLEKALVSIRARRTALATAIESANRTSQ